MTRRRWIADQYSNDRAALTGAHAAHLSRTLRARVGQEFEIVCGEIIRRGTVISVADDRVEFAVGQSVPAAAVVPVTLLLAIFKFDRLEWAIEKCTELNVTTIIPVIARRTEKHLAHAADKRVERWRRIAREASEQSRRVSPPVVTTPTKLSATLAYPLDDQKDFSSRQGSGARNGATCCRQEEAVSVVLAESERAVMLADVLGRQEAVKSLTLAIGPEGGWTAEEDHMFESARFIPCSLGDTILRAETAAIAALAIARAQI